MQVTENWRPIAGWEGLYEVSDHGRVKSLPKLKHNPHGGLFLSNEKFLKASKTNNGYLIVTLSHNKHSVRKMVHVLVAGAFLDNPNNYGYVNHDDGNKCNNSVSNLEWCTQSYNVQHAIRTGLTKKRRKKETLVE